MSLYERKHNSGSLCLQDMRMGVVIENESHEDRDVWFLGTKKNNYKKMDGVKVSNMFSDTFLDDNSLTFLRNWLISKGEIIIAVTRLRADGDINLSFGDKMLINDGKDINNTPIVKHITSYFSPHQFSHSIIDIAGQILIDAFTSFNVTVRSGAKVGVMFFPSNNVKNSKIFNGEDFNNMYEKVKKDNEKTTEENKKRYLLLCR